MRKCERLIAGFEERGIRVEKVGIDIGQMTAWCHRHRYEIDDMGRSAFGAALVACRASGLDVMTAPFEGASAERSKPPGGSKRNRGSCAPRGRASPGCGANGGGKPKGAIFSLRSTAGSPRGSTRSI